MKIQPGLGYTFDSSSSGFTIDTSEPFPGPVNSTVVYLDPYLNGDKVGATPGAVNRYIPKIGTVYLDAATPPTITVTAEGHVLVKAVYEVNKFFPRTAEIVFVTGATPPADTETDGYYPLAKINSAGGVYSMVKLGSGNLVVNRLKAGANIATWWWDVVS
jgi:hypothetical protein